MLGIWALANLSAHLLTWLSAGLLCSPCPVIHQGKPHFRFHPFLGYARPKALPSGWLLAGAPYLARSDSQWQVPGGDSEPFLLQQIVSSACSLTRRALMIH